MNDFELLKRLYEVAKSLDSELMNHVHHGKGEMTGAQYDKSNDVLIEVEDYLTRKEAHA